ncbi:MAG: hypothetical protein H6Q67_1618 [Firmicutes bacterium]|nr:hypothetical protein [Bacillota bacterium]
MTFAEQVALDMANIFTGVFVESATYDGATISVIPVIGADNEKGNTFANNGSAGRGVFWIKAVDVQWPTPGKKIVYNDITWIVARVLATDGVTHKVEATCRESAWK